MYNINKLNKNVIKLVLKMLSVETFEWQVK